MGQKMIISQARRLSTSATTGRLECLRLKDRHGCNTFHFLQLLKANFPPLARTKSILMVYDVGYQSMESRKLKQSFQHYARKFNDVLHITSHVVLSALYTLPKRKVLTLFQFAIHTCISK